MKLGKIRIRRLRWRWLVLLVMVLLVVAFVKVISSPSKGHEVAVDTQLSKVTHHAAATLPASDVSSKYFTLPLPPGYHQQTAQIVPGTLYVQTITKPSAFGSLVINIAIKAMPEGGLAGDTSYHSRLQQPERYAITSRSVGGDSVVVTNDAQSAAVVAFWPHAGYLATIAVSSGIGNPDGSDNADEIKVLSTLLPLWQWQ